MEVGEEAVEAVGLALLLEHRALQLRGGDGLRVTAVASIVGRQSSGSASSSSCCASTDARLPVHAGR